MTLTSNDIPQADVLWHVARVPEAIARGATNTDGVGLYLGDKVGRQGRYYTQAARILGLVADDRGDGSVELSPYGRAFVRYDRLAQERALRHRMMVCEPIRSVIAALMTSGGLTMDGVAHVLLTLVPMSENTAQRRARTVISWLRELGMVEWRGRRLIYIGIRLPGVEVAPPATALPLKPNQARLL